MSRGAEGEKKRRAFSLGRTPLAPGEEQKQDPDRERDRRFGSPFEKDSTCILVHSHGVPHLQKIEPLRQSYATDSREPRRPNGRQSDVELNIISLKL